MGNAFEIQQLTHAFDGRVVLDSLTFQIPSGSFFILIGPNGSGKTTLLKLLVGLMPIQQGNILLSSRPLKEYSSRQLARKIAYVAQNIGVEFPFTVTQIVLMGRAPHLGMLGFEGKTDLKMAREAMEMTGVDHLAERRLDQLSGGEQQRVFIARAICQQPEVILLDEPTAALDLAHQVRVMDLMETLKLQHDVTVVMISHDLNLAGMYADQLLLLNRGCPARLGPPLKVIDYQVLEQVYGCPVLVDKGHLGEYPRVHLVPGRDLTKSYSDFENR